MALTSPHLSLYATISLSHFVGFAGEPCGPLSPGTSISNDNDGVGSGTRPPSQGSAIVPKERPDALAGAMAAFADDESVRSQLGRHAHSVARTRYSVATVVAEYQRLYDELL